MPNSKGGSPLTAEPTAEPAELRLLRDRDYSKELTACTQQQILQATTDCHKARQQAEESQLPSVEAVVVEAVAKAHHRIRKPTWVCGKMRYIDTVNKSLAEWKAKCCITKFFEELQAEQPTIRWTQKGAVLPGSHPGRPMSSTRSGLD